MTFTRRQFLHGAAPASDFDVALERLTPAIGSPPPAMVR
jgi:hypothetical protein